MTREISKEKITDYKALLNKIGKQSRGNIYRDIWDGLKYKPKHLKLLPIWMVIGPVIIKLLFRVSSFSGFITLISYAAINLGLFVLTNEKINYTAGSMNYLIKTISVLKKLLKNRELNEIFPGFKYNKKLNTICKYGIYLKDGLGPTSLMTELGSSVLDYIRIFLGFELFAYYKISKHLDKYINDIQSIMEFTGTLDFVTNNREIIDNNVTTYPIYTKKKDINFENLIHPLVENCKPYNHNLNNSMIITGMNMAGKSTFLKSIALNQILATSFGFTFSTKFETSLLQVITSIKVEDDINSSKSKYYVEAERLLKIQNLLKGGNVLCMVDEILTGTNTEDRIGASIGLLRNYYRGKNSLVLAATHDNKIAEELFNTYDTYFFDGEIIDYDYKPKKGIISKRNALLLLEKLGIEVNC